MPVVAVISSLVRRCGTSDSQLVAPVTIRRGATLGAGTTLTREAPADALTISRAKQMTVPGWQRPVKKKQTK